MPSRSTEQDYRARVARVVAAIVADPLSEHRLEDLAAIAHFSPFHFHRVYASIVGETVSSTGIGVPILLPGPVTKPVSSSISSMREGP